MRLLSRFRQRFKHLIHRRRLDRDLEDEMRFHLDMLSHEAPERATRQFGNRTRFKEISREIFSFHSLETLAQDIRYAFRTMRKSPIFTAVAVLSLALGIGANTAIFSLLDALLLRALPVAHPEQLAQIVRTHPRGVVQTFWYKHYVDLRDNRAVFSGLAAFSPLGRATALIDGQAEELSPLLATGNYYEVLGVTPTIGRLTAPDDDRHGAPNPVAVLSYGYWQRRFAGSISVLGKTLAVNGVQVTIIGVTPPGFFGTRVGQSNDITLPLNMQSPVMGGNFIDRPVGWLTLIGRLKPDMTLQRAQAGLSPSFARILDETASGAPEPKAQFLREQAIRLNPATGGAVSQLRDQYSLPLRILLAVVGIVLMIACANVANLLLARAAAREQEISVRLAIGASWLRIVRQLLTESVLLGLVGGAAGLAFAVGAIRLLIRMVSPGEALIPLDARLNGRVLLFTLLVSTLAGVLFGAAPALRFGRRRGLTSRRFANTGLIKPLVAVQVALSMLLLVGAGLFIRTFENLWRLETGMRRDNILLFSVAPWSGGYRGARLAAYWDQLAATLRRLPDVQSVAISSQAPMGGGWGNIVSIPGWTPSSLDERYCNQDALSPGYLDTMGIPILAGRDFRIQDDAAAPKVAILNQSATRKWFGKDNPIGKRIGISGDNTVADVEVIGVTRDALYAGLNEESPNGPNVLYIPVAQAGPGAGTVEIRTLADPLRLAPDIRKTVQAADARVPLTNVRTMEVQMERSIVKERLLAAISTFFGALALLLAAIGLYGVLTYAVARRTAEIGIRMALGASRARLLATVLRDAVLLTAGGVALGIPAALALTRLAKSLLFGVQTNDPVTIVFASLLMLAIATLAGYIPARRASRVDPMVALRYE